MNREEKLKQAADRLYPNEMYYQSHGTGLKRDILSFATSEASREYWQSDAIAFMNWVMDNYYKSALYVYGWHKKDEDFNIETKSYTTEELYKEFIKQEQ